LSRYGTDHSTIAKFASQFRVSVVGRVTLQYGPKQPPLPLVELDSFRVVHVSVSQVDNLEKSVGIRLEVFR
jgi:hypothetical protein